MAAVQVMRFSGFKAVPGGVELGFGGEGQVFGSKAQFRQWMQDHPLSADDYRVILFRHMLAIDPTLANPAQFVGLTLTVDWASNTPFTFSIT